MEYKILESNGVENENIDGASFNRFCAGYFDGIVKGVLDECKLSVLGNGTVQISTGELIISGFRVKILSPFSQKLNTPAVETTYQLVSRIELVEGTKEVFFEFSFRTPKALTQDALFKNNKGLYEIEVAKFVHYPSGELVLQEQTLSIIETAQNSKLTAYPIGSIYMSLEPTSPASLFGGTWERIQERFLFASGDETLAGSIGGSKDATLVLHSHEVVAPYNLDGQPLPTAVYMGNYFGTATETGSWVVQVDKDAGYSSLGTVAKGESATNKNMPPYLAVYMWKRVA